MLRYEYFLSDWFLVTKPLKFLKLFTAYAFAMICTTTSIRFAQEYTHAFIHIYVVFLCVQIYARLMICLYWMRLYNSMYCLHPLGWAECFFSCYALLRLENFILRQISVKKLEIIYLSFLWYEVCVMFLFYFLFYLT